MLLIGAFAFIFAHMLTVGPKKHILMMTQSAGKPALSVALVIASVIIISPLFGIIFCKNSAFGDGLTQEQLTSSLGNRKADLLIKMSPTVVTTETLERGQKPTIEFRLFDSNTNQSFSHVTYYIIVEKDGKKLFYDLFHDHDGKRNNEFHSGAWNRFCDALGWLHGWI